MSTLVHFLATGCYIGYLPGAPGTWATLLLGVPLSLALKELGEGGYLLGSLGVVLVSIPLSGFVEKKLEERDPQFVVVDEIAGFLIALAYIPVSLSTLAGACALFRLFDIVKPEPARFVDRRFPGGWGITLDDVVAGLYTNILMHLFMFFRP
ncbi:MAG: phosphatidylglycerophosphatase A [bacterium]